MKLIKILTIVSVILFSGLATANPQHNYKGDKNPLMRTLHKLDLNAQQKQQLKQVMKSSKAERRILNNQMAEARRKMTKLLDTDNQDKAAIELLATEQSQLMKQRILYKAELFSQIRTVLNNEQRTKLSKMREKREKIRGIMLESI